MPVELLLKALLRISSPPKGTHRNFKFPAAKGADSDCRSGAQPFDDPRAALDHGQLFSFEPRFLFFRVSATLFCLTSDGFALFKKRHPIEASDFPRRAKAILFVKANSPVQRLCGVESDYLASSLTEFVFSR